MSTEAIVLIVVSALCAGALAWLAIDERHRRRQRRIDALAETTDAHVRQAAAEREAIRLATEAAVTHAAAADRAWPAAHGSYNPRTYVIAGVARTLARASKRRGDALRNAANTSSLSGY